MLKYSAHGASWRLYSEFLIEWVWGGAGDEAAIGIGEFDAEDLWTDHILRCSDLVGHAVG